MLRAAATLPIFPSKFEPCGLVQGELNRFGKRVIATETGGFKDTLKTEGPDANGYLFKRCANWFTKEQDEEVIKTLTIAIKDAQLMMQALYESNEDEKRPFVEQMRTISRNALNSKWEQTPDNSPHTILRLQLAYAKAVERREKRAFVPTPLSPFKL